jgi:hypothetical protein
MAAPNVNVEVQPTKGGKAYYLPIAAKSDGAPELVKIVLRLRITNNEPRPITLSDITFSFPGTGTSIPMQGVTIAMDPAGSPDPDEGAIAPRTTAVWSNGVVDLDTSEDGENTIRNEVYLNAPAPGKIKVSLSFARFSDPFNVTMDLIPFVNPTGNGAFLLPFSSADLDKGEYIVTSAQHWANGGANGTQIFAHDIEMQARPNGSWTKLLRGDGTKNNHHRIWEKPVRALADGTVMTFENDLDDNPEPGTKLSDQENHIWVKHGNVKVIYTHFKKGSIPRSLRQEGAPVKAGQQLGLVGNSGNSDYPHLHLQCHDLDTDSLRGLPFRQGWVLERELMGANDSGPWVRLTEDGICKDRVAIWPGRFVPLPPPQLDNIDEKLYAKVFGGVSKDGGGFVIVNGKFIRVPPRGPKWALFESIVALSAVEQIDGPSAEGLRREVTETIADITKDLAREF